MHDIYVYGEFYIMNTFDTDANWSYWYNDISFRWDLDEN